MEHGCQLWNPFTQKDIQVLENIQRRAARWVCGCMWDPSVFHGPNHQIDVYTCWDGHV